MANLQTYMSQEANLNKQSQLIESGEDILMIGGKILKIKHLKIRKIVTALIWSLENWLQPIQRLPSFFKNLKMACMQLTFLA